MAVTVTRRKRRRRPPWIPGTILLPEARDWLNRHGYRVKPCTRAGGQYRVIFPTGLSDVFTAEQVVQHAASLGAGQSGRVVTG